MIPYVPRKYRQLLLWAVALILLSGCTFSIDSILALMPRYVVQRELFQGVTYTREVRNADPRPLMIHVVAVDLTAPGIGFFVTPGDPGAEWQTAAMTTSAFLAQYGVQVAVNGNFFSTQQRGDFFDLIYTVGKPTSPHGLAVSDGVVYAPAEPGFSTLYVSDEGRVTINAPPARIAQAVSGWTLVLVDGVNVGASTVLEPRTGVALDRTGETLLLCVVDGRQEGLSEGVTLLELGTIMLAYGGWTGFHLDGGGSSTLVVEGADGLPLVLNSPVGNRVPGLERPVANHFGVFALPLERD